MEQNLSFINQPLQPSIVGITQSPQRKYSYYRIPQLLSNSKNEETNKSPTSFIRGYQQFNNHEKPTSKKRASRIKSQSYGRNDNDQLPTIKKKSQRIKCHGNKRSSHLLANSVISYNYPQRDEIYKQRSMTNHSKTRPNQQIKDYLQNMQQKFQQYQKQRYLHLKHPVGMIYTKGKTQSYKDGSGINQRKAIEHKMIKLVNVKTEFSKDRSTLSSIYFSFRKENILKGKLEKRIPKIPTKQDLQEFIANYIPNNHEINLQSLLRNNFCVIQYSPKEIYIGEMIGKHKNGIGILITQKSCFEGEWKNNQKLKGIEITMSGVYKGKYLNNQRFGKGQFQRHTGQIYVGDWMKGKKHGTGLWINTEGQSYQGEWRMGKANGQGVLNLRQRTYNGYFVDFKQEGFGRQFFKNGDSFQGIFRNDLPQGEGAYRWKNGSRYTGKFENGMRQGNGEMYIKDIVLIKGNFINDEPDGQCQMHFNNVRKKNAGKIIRKEQSDLIN